MSEEGLKNYKYALQLVIQGIDKGITNDIISMITHPLSGRYRKVGLLPSLMKK